MGWNYRKSVNLGGGMRLNFSKSGIGISGGVKGFRISTGPRGTRMTPRFRELVFIIQKICQVEKREGHPILRIQLEPLL